MNVNRDDTGSNTDTNDQSIRIDDELNTGKNDNIEKIGLISADDILLSVKNILIFGSGIISKKVVKELLNLSLPYNITVVMDKGMIWARELMKSKPKNLEIITVNEREEFSRIDLYISLGLNNTFDILVLTEDKSLTQSIIENVLKVNRNSSIILLNRYAPEFISVIGKDLPNVYIVDDINATREDILNVLDLSISESPAGFVPVLPEFYGKRGVDMELILKGCSIMKIYRNGKLLDPRTRMIEGDKLLLLQRGRLGFYQLTKFYADGDYSRSLKEVYMKDDKQG